MSSLPQPGHRYDFAVVGAGLAGCELALRLSAGGRDVLLAQGALDTLGTLYHPAVPAGAFPVGSVFAELAGAGEDGWTLHRRLKERLERTPGLHLLQSLVQGVSGEDGDFTLNTWEGPPLRARRVVLAVGAFLGARLTQGTFTSEAGRLGEVAYPELCRSLGERLPLETATRRAPAEAGGYTVEYRVIPIAARQGFALRGWPGAYALGACVSGEHSYASVLADAAALAAELLEGA